MSDTKGERREQQQRKDRYGMQVTGKYFWHAIANSRLKREKEREARLAARKNAAQDTKRSKPDAAGTDED